MKHKNLYLYLALACFLGIVLIFVFDGYMGIYDTLQITSREFPQKIEADQWSQQVRYGYLPSTNVEWGGQVSFTYEVDNRQFSAYVADINVSVWHNQEKVRDLMVQRMSINPFDKGQLEWVVDTSELLPKDSPPEQGYQYTVVIKRGDLERKVIVNINPTLSPPKIAIPAPTVIPAPAR